MGEPARGARSQEKSQPTTEEDDVSLCFFGPSPCVSACSHSQEKGTAIGASFQRGATLYSYMYAESHYEGRKGRPKGESVDKGASAGGRRKGLKGRHGLLLRMPANYTVVRLHRLILRVRCMALHARKRLEYAFFWHSSLLRDWMHRRAPCEDRRMRRVRVYEVILCTNYYVLSSQYSFRITVEGEFEYSVGRHNHSVVGCVDMGASATLNV